MQQQVVCIDSEHAGQKYKPRMSQVPFVAICSRGHLDDFPFEKWVHRAQNPSCKGVLRLVSRGGGGLEGQVVTCDSCGKERSLFGITASRRDKRGDERTTLTDQLSSSEDDPYFCQGARPWLGELETTCDQPVRGALRAAGNVYFPKVESSIYLPREEGAVSADMHDLMRHPAVSATMRTLYDAFQGDVQVDVLRKALLRNVPPELFKPITDVELIAGYRDLLGVGEAQPDVAAEGESELLTGDDEWRYPEFQWIRETPKDDFLSASDPGLHLDLNSHLEPCPECRRTAGDESAARLHTGKGRRPQAKPGEIAPPAPATAACPRLATRIRRQGRRNLFRTRTTTA